LAGDNVLGLSVRSFVRFRYQTCEQDRPILKTNDRICCKLAQVIYEESGWND